MSPPSCQVRAVLLYETVSVQGARHVAKDIVGQGIANPMALLLSTSMLLRHLSMHSFSDRCVAHHLRCHRVAL